MRLGVDLRCMTEGEQGGIATYARELIHRLPSHLGGFSCTGIVTGRSVRTPDVGFPVQHLRWPNKLTNASLIALHQPKLDQRIGADVFFAPTPKYLALLPKTPLTLTVHDVSFLEHPEYFTTRQRFWHTWLRFPALLKRAARIIAVSEYTARDLIRLFPFVQEKVRVIGSGADHVPAGQHAPLPNFPVQYLLAFAPRETRKNIANLLLAHQQAFPKHRIPLVLVGSGSVPAQDGVMHIPYLQPEALWRALANALAFIYPSLYEGFGFPPLEAMALDVPVICSHVTSLPAVVGDAALLVDPWDPADIAEAMVTLVQDSALRQTFIQHGQARVKHFTWERCAEQTAAVIRETIPTYAHRD